MRAEEAARGAGAPVTLGTTLAYALPGLGLALVGIPLFVYVPKFYTDVVGVDIGTIGALLLFARFFDGITDPAVGVLSDHARTPYGRRRPFMAVGALFLAAALYLFLAPASGLSPSAAAWWFGCTLAAVSLFWTLVEVPWEALGPELATDYHGRTRLMAAREGTQILGILLGVSAPAIIRWLLSGSTTPGEAALEREVFLWFGAVAAPATALLCLYCVAKVCERPQKAKHARIPFKRAAATALSNKPFVILLAAYTVGAFGANLPASLILYYVQHVLGLASAEPFLLLYILTGVLCLPGWVALAKRLGKKKAYLTAMAVNTGAFLGVLFLGQGDAVLFGVFTVLSGTGLGATLALPAAMQADVIDYDEYLSGQRREGAYIGVWAVARKLSSGLGLGLGLTLLDFAGYDPELASQPESVVWTLRLTYAALPIACNGAAIWLALRYPLDEAALERIQHAAEARGRGEAVTDPLAHS